MQLVVEGELVSKTVRDDDSRSHEVLRRQNRRCGTPSSFVRTIDAPSYVIPAPQRYQGCEYAIEPDASAASYFFAAAAITQGRARVVGLSKNSLQGDVRFADVLEKMGCRIVHGDDWIEVYGGSLHGIDIDMNAISDTVQSLAAVALFVKGPDAHSCVAHNRHKEPIG